MTRAPGNLLAVRRFLIDQIGPAARPRAGVTILDPLGDPAWEIGIVADKEHDGGYHCGSDRVRDRDYSVIESARDRAGLTLDASALDVGFFKVRTPKGVFDLRHYSRWLVQQCEANTPDTRHIREVIYSPDGKVVKRWDRLKKRLSGDKSHLGHTHESHFRDVTKAGTNVTAVYRRYLITIGVLEGDDDMSADAEKKIHSVYAGMFTGGSSMGRTVDPDGSGKAPSSNSLVAKVDYALARLDTITAGLTALAGKDWTDEPAIVAGVLAGLGPDRLAEAIRGAGLTPQQVAAALAAGGLTAEAFAAAVPPELAKQVVDELTARLAAGPTQQG